jgi:hypothetical protein
MRAVWNLPAAFGRFREMGGVLDFDTVRRLLVLRSFLLSLVLATKTTNAEYKVANER